MPARLMNEIAFRVKICGVTNRSDALMAASAGAGAIGLNFFEQSPRCVTVEQASSFVQAIPSDVLKIGVFVNHSVKFIERAVRDLGLDAIQLHGDEPPSYLSEIGPLSVIKAFRCRESSLDLVASYLDACAQLRCAPRAILLDAHATHADGGTGQTLEWNAIGEKRAELGTARIILAGGLTPDNVERAISASGADAVDTASGVESSPGRKDQHKVGQFVSNAMRAFD